MAGYWTYTGQFDSQNEFNMDGSVRKVWGTDGGYIGGATRLYTIQGARGLDAFVNFGLADSRVNEVDRSVNVGLTWTGLFDARPTDKLGFAVGAAGSGNPYQQAQIASGSGVDNYEMSYELTYRAVLNDYVTVQPDIQYIVHPGFDPTVKNDFLFGLHFEVGHRYGL
jgi:porin